MNLEQRNAFFAQLKANNPNPETELEYSSPFELLVAVLLSAQATDISVNKGTRQLFKIANTPAALLALGEDGIRYYVVKMKDDSVQILSYQLSSKLINEYTKWKNKSRGPSQGNTCDHVKKN